MERILILDDSEERMKNFMRRFQGMTDKSVTLCVCVSEAINALEECDRFDTVMLDHDLGSGCPEGDEVAKYIAEKLPVDKRPDVVIVHSHNSAASERMVLRLKEVGIRACHKPFQA
jgi:CheY-like chemotaxis protein